MRTYSPKPGDANPVWHVIDARDVVLGRLATQAAALLRGKHKPTFAPHMDMGDFVIIINADKVALSGSKLKQKFDYRHSGRPGGLSATPQPKRRIKRTPRGERPRTRTRRALRPWRIAANRRHPRRTPLCRPPPRSLRP